MPSPRLLSAGSVPSTTDDITATCAVATERTGAVVRVRACAIKREAAARGLIVAQLLADGRARLDRLVRDMGFVDVPGRGD